MRFVWPVLSALLFFVSFSLAATSGKDVVRALKNRGAHVLVVEGTHPRAGSYLYKRSKTIDPDQVKRVFQDMGFSASVSDIDPNGSVSRGALRIVREISSSSKPVVVVAHSLGGLKALEALRISKTAQNNTFGLIMLHVPYWGSIATEQSMPVSRKVMETFLEPERVYLDVHDAWVDASRTWADIWCPWRHLNPFWMANENSVYFAHKMANRAYRTVMIERTRMITEEIDYVIFHYLMGDGDPVVMKDLSTSFRRNYMNQHASEFRAMQIPIVSVVGRDGRTATEPGIRRALGSSPNDGLLLASEQEFLSGRNFVEINRYLHHLEIFLQPSANLDTWTACVDELVRLASRLN
jgi:hypothetical protein